MEDAMKTMVDVPRFDGMVDHLPYCEEVRL